MTKMRTIVKKKDSLINIFYVKVLAKDMCSNAVPNVSEMFGSVKSYRPNPFDKERLLKTRMVRESPGMRKGAKLQICKTVMVSKAIILWTQGVKRRRRRLKIERAKRTFESMSKMS